MLEFFVEPRSILFSDVLCQFVLTEEPPLLTCDQERGIRQPGKAACAQASLLFIFNLFNMDPYRVVKATSSWFPALCYCGPVILIFRIAMQKVTINDALA